MISGGRVLACVLALAAALPACGADPPNTSSSPRRADEKVQVPMRIVWQNAMGEGFLPERIVVTVDGGTMVDLKKLATDGTDPLDKKELELWSSQVYTVPHVLHAKVTYRGHGYGVFAYLSQYTFTAEGDHTTFPGWPATTTRIVGYEQGAPTTAIENRPALRYIDTFTPPEGRTSDLAEGGG